MSSLLRCALVALVLAGCATTSGADYTGRTEVRGRLVLHSNPSFSFQLADDWRMATAADWPRFGPNARVLGRLNDYGKQQFNQAGAVEMKRYPFVLISTNGAWVNSGIGRNQGVKYRSGYVLNEAEKKTLWQAIEAIAAKLSVPTDRPKLTFQAADIRDFGPNSVLVLRFLREDQRGSFVWTVFGFFGDQHIVTLEHAGTSADGEEGLRGLEAMAASFRFE